MTSEYQLLVQTASRLWTAQTALAADSEMRAAGARRTPDHGGAAAAVKSCVGVGVGAVKQAGNAKNAKRQGMNANSAETLVAAVRSSRVLIDAVNLPTGGKRIGLGSRAAGVPLRQRVRHRRIRVICGFAYLRFLRANLACCDAAATTVPEGGGRSGIAGAVRNRAMPPPACQNAGVTGGMATRGDLAGMADKVWTAEEVLRTDQRAFGGAWRYERVDGRIVAHAAPTPAHA